MEAQTRGSDPTLSRDLFASWWTVVRGGGEIVSGAVQRLRWAGLPVVVTELARPLVVRRPVSFANAVFEGQCQVEATPARLVRSVAEARSYLRATPEGVPVLVDPQAQALAELNPTVLIDGRMAKRPLDTRVGQAPLVIALGPGFKAGVHADAVVETKGGSQCGRVYFAGTAIEDTGLPCVSSGYRQERVLRAPVAGVFQARKEIGQFVEVDEVVGWVRTPAGEVPVKAQISGMLRGLLHSGLQVPAGVKLGDVDHRGESSDCCRVSEKADSVAAGVLEALLKLAVLKGLLGRPRTSAG